MLIFLDIDGVMVPATGHKAPALLEDGFAAFSEQACSTLNLLIAKYDPAIMLTTSHKSNYGISEWVEIFKARGIVVGKIQCLPENAAFLSRKDEIVNWVDANGIHDEFIIIDDDRSLNDLPVDLKKRLVLTSGFVGLNSGHLDEIKDILNLRDNQINMPSLTLIVIKTDKLQEQAALYSALGYEFEYHQHGKGPLHYASKNSNPTIEIYPLPKSQPQPDSTLRLGFTVTDLQQTIQATQDKGAILVTIPAPTEWGYSAVIQDLDGRKIELTQA